MFFWFFKIYPDNRGGVQLMFFSTHSVVTDFGRSRATIISAKEKKIDQKSNVSLLLVDAHVIAKKSELLTAKSTAPNKLRHNAKGARDAKHDGVVALLGETVVDEQAATVRVDVGPRVGNLALLGEHARRNLVHLRDEAKELVVGQVLERILALSRVTRISLAEHSVAKAWHNTTALEGIPKILLNIGVGRVGTNFGLHSKHPVEDFLVGETVKRAGKASHASSERKVRIREGRANKVSGVGRHVATFVVSVDRQVKTHELRKFGRFKAELGGVSSTPTKSQNQKMST